MSKQKYEEKIEQWLVKWEEKFRTASTGKDHTFQEKLNEMKVVHQDIRDKLNEMKQQNENDGWEDMKSRVDKLVGHIDESFRESLAYFH